MARIITIIGKSPSAAHAQEWIDQCPGTDVATVNEAGLILRADQPIRFGFFVHPQFAEPMWPLWSRIDCFVSPRELLLPATGPGTLPQGFPTHKRVSYEGNACGAEADALRAKLLAGEVTHHHTVTAAMSWLAKIGYRRLRLIGFGGGAGYAPGFVGRPEPTVNLVEWVEVERTLAALLMDIYGCKTERYGE
jgi:hypothetical protein